MQKIIQIATDTDQLFALTEDGKLYERTFKSEKTGEEEWTDTWSWEEILPTKKRVRNTKGEIPY